MDSVTRQEFHKIFDRVSMDVDLQGATNAVFIENRLKIVRHMSKTKAKDAKLALGRQFYGFKTEELDKLIEHDFAGRAIFEAHIDPHGIINLTLIHGRQMAQQRIMAQKRAALRLALAQRFPDVSRIPERPEFRRIPTRRR